MKLCFAAHMNGASSRRLDDGLGFLYRGELLLRRKEIVRRRFLRIGQNDQRLRHEKRRTMNSASKTLTRGGLTNIQVPTAAKIPKRKIFPLFWIAFLEILI
jgi:hypothetical protein